MTILIGQTGAIEMIANSDWPLESLARERGAKSAYRVSEHRGRVQVEACEGSRTCTLEARSTAQTARLLLGPGPNSYDNLAPALRR